MELVMPTVFGAVVVSAVLFTAYLHRQIINDYRDDLKQRDKLIVQLINAKQFNQPIMEPEPMEMGLSDEAKSLVSSLRGDGELNQ